LGILVNIGAYWGILGNIRAYWGNCCSLVFSKLITWFYFSKLFVLSKKFLLSLSGEAFYIITSFMNKHGIIWNFKIHFSLRQQNLKCS
jgi:hypothetical protein